MLIFEHNMGAESADGCLTLTKFGSAWSQVRNLSDKNRQKVERFEPVYLGKYKS